MKKWQKIIGHGLRRPPYNIYTQQPIKNTWVQWRRNRRGDSRGGGVRGKGDTIVFGAIELEGGKNIK
jgi:hypothetical protein